MNTENLEKKQEKPESFVQRVGLFGAFAILAFVLAMAVEINNYINYIN